MRSENLNTDPNDSGQVASTLQIKLLYSPVHIFREKNNPLISKGWATHMKIHQCIPEVLIFNKTPKCVGSILTLIKYMI